MRVFAYATLVVAALGAATVAVPAQAADKPQPKVSAASQHTTGWQGCPGTLGCPQVAEEKAQHCVVDVSAPNSKPTCYDSFTTAIAKATKGRVTDAPANVRTAMNDPKLNAQLNDTSFAPAGGFVASIEWDGKARTGSTMTYTAPSGCTDTLNDIDWVKPYVGDAWNDRISSYRGYSNCWVRHWENPDYWGIGMGFDSGRDDLEYMDNATSSIEWS